MHIRRGQVRGRAVQGEGRSGGVQIRRGQSGVGQKYKETGQTVCYKEGIRTSDKGRTARLKGREQVRVGRRAGEGREGSR